MRKAKTKKVDSIVFGMLFQTDSSSRAYKLVFELCWPKLLNSQLN